MTIGDPRKALVLAVIAVIVCGVAVFRMLPKPEVAVQTLLVPQQAQAPASDTPAYPQSVSHDPFSHPLIRTTSSPQPKPVASNSAPLKVEIDGELPEVPGHGQLGEGSKPEENAGEDRKPEQEAPVRVIRLDAVMTVNEPVVVLRLNSGSPVSAKLGEFVFGDVKVVEIGPRTVRLKSGKQVLEVSLGDSVTL